MSIWIIIFVCLVLSAFFSGMEIAFVSSNKFLIELENKKGRFPAKILSKFTANPGQFISTLLVGNNIALVVYGIMMALLLEPFIEYRMGITSSAWILVIQTIISTLIILLTAEFLPKVLFRINPNRMLVIFALPVYLAYTLLYPVSVIITKISEFLLMKVAKVSISKEKPDFGKVDLDNYIQEATSNPSAHEDLDNEIKIFKNALSFAEIKIRECMVPRTEIIASDINETVEDLKAKFVDTGLSKILIYKESIDDIIGYVHSFEMFKKPKDIKSIMRPIDNVPESMQASDLLKILMQKHRSIAVVVDEFGGTSGIITIEDVVEEIFGEIHDEHDVEELTEKKISDTEFELSARLEIDYLNDKYNLDLPVSENFETLSGLIIEEHESIPAKGEEIRLDKFLFIITEVSDTVIETVTLKIFGRE